jgi:hypothetical protein
MYRLRFRLQEVLSERTPSLSQIESGAAHAAETLVMEML